MEPNSHWCTPLDERISSAARETALFGMLGGLTFGAKLVMMGLPNIEPVSLLVMLFAVTFGKKALFPVFVYVLLELAVFGIGLWTAAYVYIWPLLAVVACLLRKMHTPLGWAMLSGLFGLLFGALCTPVCLFTGGPAFALSWWISGIPFDLAHCAGNFALALILFSPLRKLFAKHLPHLQKNAPMA